jgi:hypothetical protein
LRYSDFVVPLVKAVQELSQKVEKLEAALAEKIPELLQRSHPQMLLSAMLLFNKTFQSV